MYARTVADRAIPRSLRSGCPPPAAHPGPREALVADRTETAVLLGQVAGAVGRIHHVLPRQAV